MFRGSDESASSEADSAESAPVASLGEKRHLQSSKTSSCIKGFSWKFQVIMPLNGGADLVEQLSEIPKKRHESIACFYITAQFDAMKLASAFDSENVPVEGFVQLSSMKTKTTLERPWMPGSSSHLACEWTRIHGGLRGNPDFEAYMSRDDPFVTTVLHGELKSNNAGREKDKQAKLMAKDQSKRARSVPSNADSRSTSFSSTSSRSSSSMPLGSSNEVHHFAC